MRALQPLLFLLCWVLMLGCAHESTVSFLDNHGGFSHAGRRIELHSDGSYSDTGYTDVIGNESVEHGVYTLNIEKTHLTLSPASGEVEHLYRVDYGRQQYWVHEQERRRITQSGESWLRQISLRVDAP
ncbi:MAG: hypothetical protein NTX40_08890 [Planctomycetota bacterium]|nr:hypothetical protein [Planctomycetota bacterium]